MNLELLKVDFQNIYQVYRNDRDRREQLFKLLLYIAVSPYVVIATLLSSNAITFEDIKAVNNLDNVIYVIFVVVGIAIHIPLYRFISLADNIVRCARAINNFRRVYVENLAGFPGFEIRLPVEPDYPKERQFKSNSFWVFLFFIFISSSYLWAGVQALTGGQAFSWTTLLLALVHSLIALILFHITGKSRHYSKEPAKSHAYLSGDIGIVWKQYVARVLNYYSVIPDDRGKILEGVPAFIELTSFDDGDEVIEKFGKKETIALYTKKIFSDVALPEFGFSYGEKLFGQQFGNQIGRVLEKLKGNTFSKSAVATVLVPSDLSAASVPCLLVIDFKVRNNKLFLHCMFRSQNVMNSYANFYSLRNLQVEMASRLGIDCGNVTIFITSPHLYQADITAACIMTDIDRSKYSFPTRETDASG